MAYNPAATNFTTELNVINPLDYSATPYFTVNSTGAYANGVLIAVETASAAVTAFAGGGQASGTLLTSQYNLVTVCATNFDSVRLPSAVAALTIVVKNVGAAILSVFPFSGDSINAMAVNLSIDIPIGGEVTFNAIDATVWHTLTTLDLPAPSTQKGNLVIKAADNATNTQTIITNASQAAARTYSIPDAGGNDSFAFLAAAQTLTNKTINGAIFATDNAVASATLTRTSSTTLTNVAGMVVTVVPGTYRFRVDAPCVSTANTGIKVGFKLTTTVITSGAISGKGFSAAASETGAYSTTVTDQALWYDTAAGVDLKIEIDGTLVIGTGGTMQFQMGQHTSHGDSTSIYAGSYMTFTRIA